MKARALLLAAAGMLALPAGAPAAEAVTDGSFEAGSPDNPHWVETSTRFGSPLCDPSLCRDDTGQSGARTGTRWAAFGASIFSETEDASIAQAIAFPKGSAVLRFFLWIGSRSGNGADRLRVVMDGKTIWEIKEDAAGYAGYREVELGIHSYADGAVHTLAFGFRALATPEGSSDFTTMNLDDVSIDAIAAPTPKKAGVPFCKGKPATLVGSDLADTLVGGNGSDVLILGGGNDRAKTKGGNDTVCADAGKDVVIAGGGKDLVIGGGGNDTLKGGGGNDKLIGGGGKDVLIGGGGTDVCKGGGGKDKGKTCEKGKV